MFDVDGMTITLTVGDTGAVRIRSSGYNFQTDDAILFTVKTGNGSVMFDRVFTNKRGEGIRWDGPIEEDNSVIVCFHNKDTEGYSAGPYTWDVRYIIKAYRDDTGAITDGDQVITPYGPQQLILKSAVGTV